MASPCSSAPGTPAVAWVIHFGFTEVFCPLGPPRATATAPPLLGKSTSLSRPVGCRVKTMSGYASPLTEPTVTEAWLRYVPGAVTMGVWVKPVPVDRYSDVPPQSGSSLQPVRTSRSSLPSLLMSAACTPS